MTSLNAIVIGIRLIISLFIQRLLHELVGEAGIAKIGSLRNLLQMLTSLGTLGIFSGIVKYVSEHKENPKQLQRLFSTAFVFTCIGSIVTGLILFIGAPQISMKLFTSSEYTYILRILAIVIPFLSLNRVFQGVVNGLSRYKQFSKIELLAYILSSVLTVVFLYQYNIDGVLIAIAITPVLQLLTLLYIFIKVLREYVQFSQLSFKIPIANSLLAFSLMSFVSTVILNFVEIDIRSMITQQITENAAGVWTEMTFISKNYMVFSTALFTLYVLPKFAGIHHQTAFFKEVKNIYKTLLPIFGLGMILVYLFRNIIIQIIYPDSLELEVLFKWQLLGDFVKLASVVLAHQFLAKKLVRNFIFTELLSLVLFYVFAKYLSDIYGVEGVVMGHFLRYIIYFLVVLVLVLRYFRKQTSKKEASSN